MSKEHSPDVIAQSFLKQFYEMLSKKPSELHKFYMEQSHFLHCENSQKCESVHGTEAIREQISQLNLFGAQVDVTNGSIDAQRSDNNGIVVVVTGHYTPWEQATRPFIQTFFLACQTKNGASTYFVSNSVFRVVGDVAYPSALVGVPPLVTDPAAFYGPGPPYPPVFDPQAATYHPGMEYYTPNPPPMGYPMPGLTQPALAEETIAPAAAAAPVVVAEARDEEPVESAEQAEAAEDAAEEAALESVSAEEQQEEESGGTKSYSDIVRKIKAAAAAASGASDAKPAIRVIPTKQAPAANGGVAAGAKTAAPASKTAGTKSNEKASAEKASSAASASAAPKPNHTIYVSNLPDNCNYEDLRKLFQQFGPIRSLDVLTGRSYTFIKYENVAGMRAALAAGRTIDFKGKQVRIEEKSGVGREGGSGKSGAKSSSSSGKAPAVTKSASGDGAPPAAVGGGDRKKGEGRRSGAKIIETSEETPTSK